MRIPQKFITAAQVAGACPEAIQWLAEKPRTIQQLAERSQQWALWEIARHDTKLVVGFSCDCAELSLPQYESAYPDDSRPRQAIQAARDFIEGKITRDELTTAAESAWSAAESAEKKELQNQNAALVKLLTQIAKGNK